MRKLLTSVFFLISIQLVQAQAPQALNYQAVARTADGVIIPTQNISVRFSILDGSVSGTTLYSETQQTTTNSYGLFTLSIGKGTPVTSTFSNINWASGTDKFLKIEIAPGGGSNYQLQGTTQLLSVPYALYSEKTRLIAGNNTIAIANGNTITGNYQSANNTILINGNTIGGNYQAANNTILINSNSIAGNYQAANNTILLNGNTIAGNYQAGTGINITGNTIFHNLVAGAGIDITGNVISSTNGNYWIADANGIHAGVQHVGIGLNSHTQYPLHIRQPSFGGLGGGIAFFESDDSWHAAVAIKNNLSNSQFTFIVAGPTNTNINSGNFGLFDHQANNWVFSTKSSSDFIGFGGAGLNALEPKSRVHVFGGDVNIDQIGSGIILKSPNGQCWRVTIDNTGNLVRTAITCPN